MTKITATVVFEVEFELEDAYWDTVENSLDMFFALQSHPSVKILSDEIESITVLTVNDESVCREDDSEEVKQEAERTPCPKCGKLPEVQQHSEGLGVSHICNGTMHICTPGNMYICTPGEVNFRGYAPDWIAYVKQNKQAL